MEAESYSVSVAISSQYFEHPDKEASQKMIGIDVYIPHDQDILSVAFDITCITKKYFIYLITKQHS